MSDIAPVSYEKVLSDEGRLIALNKGRSMMPLLREGRDVMVIERKDGRCKKYDAVLYKRGEKYILHRVIKVRENDYVIVGDNCRRLEYGITDSDILGVLVAVLRDGKREFGMDCRQSRIYAHLWCDLYPLRAAILFCRDAVCWFVRRVGRLLKNK